MDGADPFDGLTPEELGWHAQAEADPLKFEPRPFILRDPAQIRQRQFLYGKHLIRGFVSATVGGGGFGKSSLEAVDALAMVTGRALLGDRPTGLLRVWSWNGEDPHEELERRVAAACLHHGIAAPDIGDRLLMDSGRDVPITLAATGLRGITIATPTTDALICAMREHRIDVLTVDPFVACHAVPENDNGAINAVIAEWRRVADAADCAVELVHHVSKAGAMADGDMGIYAARGAGALIDGVRSARYLTRMRPEEAERFGIEDATRYFRVSMGKANLAPAEKATWRQMVGVPLGNGTGLFPEGDNVGVCVAWSPPDAFDGMTVRDLRRVQDAFATLDEPAKANERARDWGGCVVADVLGLDIGVDLRKEERTAAQNMARAKTRQLLSGWIRTGALAVDTVRSARDGRDVKVIAVGEPVTEADIRGAS